MDYLELDDSAMRAFQELGGHSDLQRSSKLTMAASTQSRSRPRRRIQATYLLRIDHPLPTTRDVATALGLSRVPQLESGTAEDGEASFCRLSQSNIDDLDTWVAKHHPNQRFTKIRIGLAHKDPGGLPMLGCDATLPHHRPRVPVSPTAPYALEYPVRYFFYGTLADPARLERLFGVPASEIPPLRPATLLGGCVKTWAGTYRAVVDEPGATVGGFVSMITTADQEEALRVYEGDNYEVVAAMLIVDGKKIMGRTFRFAGFDDDLTD